MDRLSLPKSNISPTPSRPVVFSRLQRKTISQQAREAGSVGLEKRRSGTPRDTNRISRSGSELSKRQYSHNSSISQPKVAYHGASHRVSSITSKRQSPHTIRDTISLNGNNTRGHLEHQKVSVINSIGRSERDKSLVAYNKRPRSSSLLHDNNNQKEKCRQLSSPMVPESRTGSVPCSTASVTFVSPPPSSHFELRRPTPTSDHQLSLSSTNENTKKNRFQKPPAHMFQRPSATIRPSNLVRGSPSIRDDCTSSSITATISPERKQVSFPIISTADNVIMNPNVIDQSTTSRIILINKEPCNSAERNSIIMDEFMEMENHNDVGPPSLRKTMRFTSENGELLSSQTQGAYNTKQSKDDMDLPCDLDVSLSTITTCTRASSLYSSPRGSRRCGTLVLQGPTQMSPLNANSISNTKIEQTKEIPTDALRDRIIADTILYNSLNNTSNNNKKPFALYGADDELAYPLSNSCVADVSSISSCPSSTIQPKHIHVETGVQFVEPICPTQYSKYLAEARRTASIRINESKRRSRQLSAEMERRSTLLMTSACSDTDNRCSINATHNGDIHCDPSSDPPPISNNNNTNSVNKGEATDSCSWDNLGSIYYNSTALYGCGEVSEIAQDNIDYIPATPTAVQDDDTATPTAVQEHTTATPTAVQEDDTATPTAVQEHITATPTAVQEHITATPTAVQEDDTATPTAVQEDDTATPTAVQEHTTATPTAVQEHITATPTAVQEHITDTVVHSDDTPTYLLDLPRVTDDYGAAVILDEAVEILCSPDQQLYHSQSYHRSSFASAMTVGVLSPNGFSQCSTSPGRLLVYEESQHPQKSPVVSFRHSTADLLERMTAGNGSIFPGSPQVNISDDNIINYNSNADDILRNISSTNLMLDEVRRSIRSASLKLFGVSPTRTTVALSSECEAAETDNLLNETDDICERKENQIQTVVPTPEEMPCSGSALSSGVHDKPVDNTHGYIQTSPGSLKSVAYTNHDEGIMGNSRLYGSYHSISPCPQTPITKTMDNQQIRLCTPGDQACEVNGCFMSVSDAGKHKSNFEEHEHESGVISGGDLLPVTVHQSAETDVPISGMETPVEAQCIPYIIIPPFVDDTKRSTNIMTVPTSEESPLTLIDFEQCPMCKRHVPPQSSLICANDTKLFTSVSTQTDPTKNTNGKRSRGCSPIDTNCRDVNCNPRSVASGHRRTESERLLAMAPSYAKREISEAIAQIGDGGFDSAYMRPQASRSPTPHCSLLHTRSSVSLPLISCGEPLPGACLSTEVPIDSNITPTAQMILSPLPYPPIPPLNSPLPSVEIQQSTSRASSGAICSITNKFGHYTQPPPLPTVSLFPDTMQSSIRVNTDLLRFVQRCVDEEKEQLDDYACGSSNLTTPHPSTTRSTIQRAKEYANSKKYTNFELYQSFVYVEEKLGKNREKAYGPGQLNKIRAMIKVNISSPNDNENEESLIAANRKKSASKGNKSRSKSNCGNMA